MPQNTFFSTNSWSSGQPKNDRRQERGINIIGICTASWFWFNFHCYTQREATPIQKLARKCAVTFHDFLRERLQRAFTLANQLHWIAQQNRSKETYHQPNNKKCTTNTTKKQETIIHRHFQQIMSSLGARRQTTKEEGHKEENRQEGADVGNVKNEYVH